MMYFIRILMYIHTYTYTVYGANLLSMYLGLMHGKTC